MYRNYFVVWFLSMTLSQQRKLERWMSFKADIKWLYLNPEDMQVRLPLLHTTLISIECSSQWSLVGLGLLEGKDWKEMRRFTLRCLRDMGFGKRSMEGMMQEQVQEICSFLRFTSRTFCFRNFILMMEKFLIRVQEKIWVNHCT